MTVEKHFPFIHTECLNRETIKIIPKIEYEEETRFVTLKTAQNLRSFHPEVVLIHPQIPQNTGSIARLCAAWSVTLHIVKPIPFELSEKKVRRAGLDYWDQVEVFVHESFDELLKVRNERRWLLVETGNGENPAHFSYQPGDMLVFGAETFGIPKENMKTILNDEKNKLLTIPMFHRGVRSINLANTVSAVALAAISNLHKT